VGEGGGGRMVGVRGGVRLRAEADRESMMK